MPPKEFNPDYLVPGTHIGAFVVRTMLGQGEFSSVHEAESAKGHRFALKVCRYGRAPLLGEAAIGMSPSATERRAIPRRLPGIRGGA